VSTAERRALINGEKKTIARVSDLWGTIPAINGKIELVYEGEQEGPVNVAKFLISKAIRTQFVNYFPDPERIKRAKEKNPYEQVILWFNQNNEVDLLLDEPNAGWREKLLLVEGLESLVKQFHKEANEDEKLLLMEFALYGLASFSLINRMALDSNVLFKDLMSSVFSDEDFDEDEEDYNLN
jgi:magnesium chelatase subunit I